MFRWLTDDTEFDGPTIHVGEFFSKGTEFDTFLDMSANFTKVISFKFNSLYYV